MNSSRRLVATHSHLVILLEVDTYEHACHSKRSAPGSLIISAGFHDMPNNLTCASCGATAAKASALRAHQRKHQLRAQITVDGVLDWVKRTSDEERWRCPMQACSWSTISISSLRDHIKLQHEVAPAADFPPLSVSWRNLCCYSA